MNNFFEELLQTWNLDLIILVICLLSGFFQERYLSGWALVKDARLCAALKTLIVSLGASTIYIVISYNQMKGQADGAAVLVPWGKYFITFFTATSIYDLLIRPFRRWIAKVTGEKDEDAKP
jgi:hypothetical protein